MQLHVKMKAQRNYIQSVQGRGKQICLTPMVNYEYVLNPALRSILPPSTRRNSNELADSSDIGIPSWCASLSRDLLRIGILNIALLAAH